LKLPDKVLDMEIYSRFGNRQFIGNLLVAMAVAYQSENLKLSDRQRLLPQMLGNARSDDGSNNSSS
jgi:hypothetical protein